MRRGFLGASRGPHRPTLGLQGSWASGRCLLGATSERKQVFGEILTLLGFEGRNQWVEDIEKEKAATLSSNLIHGSHFQSL